MHIPHNKWVQWGAATVIIGSCLAGFEVLVKSGNSAALVGLGAIFAGMGSLLSGIAALRSSRSQGREEIEHAASE